jgi:hypothetical protein
MTLIDGQKKVGSMASPFNLVNDAAYQQWREGKLLNCPTNISDARVEIRDPCSLSSAEQTALLDQIQHTNMALYCCKNAILDKQSLKQLGAQLGLNRLDSNLCADEDGISSIQIEPKGSKQEYIPYSDHLINWHTDGYYNTAEHTIRGMALHCVSPSASGGTNGLIDHERIYIELRDRDVHFIEALMQTDVMTIPANIQAGVEIRPAQSGPVFSIDLDGNLHMRYTARSRSIEWKQDVVTQQAVQVLTDLLSAPADYIYQYRLNAGEGIICNNVLHSRSRIVDTDSDTRLLYRARYFDRVRKTD